MSEQSGVLRVHGQAEAEVELVIAYLVDLQHAYDSLVVLGDTLDRLGQDLRGLQPSYYRLAMVGVWPFGPRRRLAYGSMWELTHEQIASLVPQSEQLILSSVQLTSPGFWQFNGLGEALETIRKYLNDRHDRRKDKEYRESAERRRLEAENVIKESEAMSARIRNLRELGATDKDLEPLLKQFVYKPLTALGRHQDNGVIEDADNPRQREEQ
jgi:hypothetical protein